MRVRGADHRGSLTLPEALGMMKQASTGQIQEPSSTEQYRDRINLVPEFGVLLRYKAAQDLLAIQGTKRDQIKKSHQQCKGRANSNIAHISTDQGNGGST